MRLVCADTSGLVLVMAGLVLGLGRSLVGAPVPGSGSAGVPFAFEDPVCRITNGPARPQAPGTLRMAERLKRLRETADPTATKFMNDRLIPLLQEQIKATADPRQRTALRLRLGREWVFSGRALEGIREFDAVDQSLREMNAKFGGSGAREMRMSRGIAFLRLGEQENCLATHNSDSCIFPLQPGGVHRLPRGSRGAIPLLSEQLDAMPDDLAARWLLNIAYMTLGEWPGKVPDRWLIQPKVFEAEHDIGRFPEIAGSLGLDVNDLAGGCILDDFDNDGLLDVVASSWALFTNTARDAGVFEEVESFPTWFFDYHYSDFWSFSPSPGGGAA